jgi:Helix-turn-helix domain of transposase family ISL3
VVAQVPWARHGAGHTLAFDDTAAWLAVHTSKQAAAQIPGVVQQSMLNRRAVGARDIHLGALGGRQLVQVWAGFPNLDEAPHDSVTSCLIPITWPPVEHSCGPRPVAGAMLQSET